MFEKLFQHPSTIARHREAPYAEERVRYLEHCAQQGYSLATLLFKARELLWIARKLNVYPDLRVTLHQVEAVAQKWEERELRWGQRLNPHWTKIRFLEVARPWLRFLGYLTEPRQPIPLEEKLQEFVSWMEHERGLAASTIQSRMQSIRGFLCWFGNSGRSLSDIRLTDVDQYLIQGAAASWSRISVSNVTADLRSFFRYGATQGWCTSTLADTIQGPRIFSMETLPVGLTWPEIQRVIASLDTDHPGEVRDRIILMLFSIYGLRASEVAHLCLDNLDWEYDRIHVFRSKRRESQTYPLIPAVGHALIRYLQNVRPPSAYREVFLTLLPPYRPLTRDGLYSLTRKRLTSLGLHPSHYGPHALRHACATRLVAEGLSLKEIGDHLGHRSTSATRIYAKVDLVGLREVASFDLGGLL